MAKINLVVVKAKMNIYYGLSEQFSVTIGAAVTPELIIITGKQLQHLGNSFLLLHTFSQSVVRLSC